MQCVCICVCVCVFVNILLVYKCFLLAVSDKHLIYLHMLLEADTLVNLTRKKIHSSVFLLLFVFAAEDSCSSHRVI